MRHSQHPLLLGRYKFNHSKIPLYTHQNSQVYIKTGEVVGKLELIQSGEENLKLYSHSEKV